MKKLEQILGLDAEELTREALKQKITTNRFRLPMTAADASRMLQAFYRAEVINRGRVPERMDALGDVIGRTSHVLTSASYTGGALLCGRCGNGKTTLLLAVKSLIEWLGDKDVVDPLRWQTYFASARSITEEARRHRTGLSLTATAPLLFLDDLGEEPVEVMDYGNVINPVVNILEQRYNRQRPTFITTNLTAREITEKYGVRIGDRLREMVTVIAMPESIPSFRR